MLCVVCLQARLSEAEELKRLAEDKAATLKREVESLLAKLTALDGGKAAAELEMARRLQEEKEKRIGHLQRMAARRIGKRDLSRGWSAWFDKWSHHRWQMAQLRQCGAMLSKPKLAKSFHHWNRDWEAAERERVSPAPPLAHGAPTFPPPCSPPDAAVTSPTTRPTLPRALSACSVRRRARRRRWTARRRRSASRRCSAR